MVKIVRSADMRKDSYDLNRNNIADSAEKIFGVEQQSANTVYGRNQNGITGFYPLPVSQINGKTGSVVITLADLLFNPVFILDQELVLQNNLAYYEQSSEFDGYTLHLPQVSVDGSFIYISKNGSYKPITLVGPVELGSNLILDRPNQYVMLHCVGQRWKILFYGNPLYQLGSAPISPMENFLYIPRLNNYQSLQLADPGPLSEWRLDTSHESLRFNPITRILQFNLWSEFNLDEIVFYLVSKTNPDLFDKLVIKTSLIEQIRFSGKVNSQIGSKFNLVYPNPVGQTQSALSFVSAGNSVQIVNQLVRTGALLTKIPNTTLTPLDSISLLGSTENRSLTLTRTSLWIYAQKTTQNLEDQINFSGNSSSISGLSLTRTQPKLSSVISAL